MTPTGQENKKMETNMKEMNLNEMEKTAGGVNRVPCRKSNSDNGGIIGMVVDLIKGLFD